MFVNFQTGVLIIFCLCISFFQMTVASSKLSWTNCDSESDTIKLLNVTITPPTIVIPGSFSVQIAIHTDKDITSPLKAQLSLSRKIVFTSVSIPCISGIGSCTYNDVCAICPQCGCPLKAGDHVLTLPMTVDTSIWGLAGTYQATVNIETNTGEKGCVELHNILIESRE